MLSGLARQERRHLMLLMIALHAQRISGTVACPHAFQTIAPKQNQLQDNASDVKPDVPRASVQSPLVTQVTDDRSYEKRLSLFLSRSTILEHRRAPRVAGS